MTAKDGKKDAAAPSVLKDEQLDDVQGGAVFFDKADAVRAEKGSRGAKSVVGRGSKTEGLKVDGGKDGEPKQTADKLVAAGGDGSI